MKPVSVQYPGKKETVAYYKMSIVRSLYDKQVFLTRVLSGRNVFHSLVPD